MWIINVVLTILVLKLAAAASCNTTKGKIGDCVPVSQCPEILNPRSMLVQNSTRDLERFKCGQSDEGILVCCSRKSDALIFENRNKSSTKLQNQKICGVRPEVDEHLRKDIDSIPDFPWLVGILTNIDGTIKVRCTGTLLSSRYVLTSAQCLISPGDNPTVFVRTEQFYLKNWDDCPGYRYQTPDKTDTRKCARFKDYSVEERITHKDYDPTTHFNDIALLRLSTLIAFEDYIRPVCLPIAETEQAQVGDVLYTSEWAKTDDIESYPYKRWSVYKNSSTTVLPNKSCQQCISGSHSGDKYDICSTKPEHATKITCDDVIDNPVMFEYNNRWYVEGITHSCSGCGEAMVHTKVGDYISWIEENIRSEKCTTPNGYAGEYVYISDCPVLLDSFANPLNDTEEYLRSFLYESKAESWQFALPLVCCGTSSNFMVYKKPLSATIVTNISTSVDIWKYCGWQNRDGYFSTNQNTTTDEFPWAAAIYNKDYYNRNSESGDYLSSGSIINNRYILTAARSGLEDLKNKLVVRLGEYQVRNDKDCSDIPELDLEECSNVVDYGVEEVITHPFSRFIPNIFNIALLRLNKTITFSDYVRPICLPSSNASVIKEGDVLYTTGWSSPQWVSVVKNQIKKKISTEVLSNRKCRQMNMLNRPKDVSALQFCTQDFKNATALVCDRDSGSPVMLYQKHQWYVAGISFTYFCNDRDPHVHTKVSTYLPWIYSNIKP